MTNRKQILNMAQVARALISDLNTLHLFWVFKVT